jgi:glycosyltransferase involved in cell wall biosynthesis
VSLFTSRSPQVVRRCYRPEFTRALADLRRAQAWDGVWVERIATAESAWRAGFERFVLDVDALESVCYYRQLRHSPRYLTKPLHYAECAKLYLHERLLVYRAAGLVVCSDADHRFWGRRPRRVFTVSNGVSNVPASDPAQERSGELLFVGSLSYQPNVDALQFFVGSVWAELRQHRPGARLTVAGRDPAPAVAQMHDGQSVFVHANVPDVTPYYDSASVVVVPIRQGGGTRLKVLEALIKGKALVATSVGAEGLDLRPGVDFEMADEPAAIRAACDRLLRDSEQRRRLGASGRARVLEKYGWSQAVDQAEKALAFCGSNQLGDRGGWTATLTASAR